jgi:hypothetical protein
MRRRDNMTVELSIGRRRSQICQTICEQGADPRGSV